MCISRRRRRKKNKNRRKNKQKVKKAAFMNKSVQDSKKEKKMNKVDEYHTSIPALKIDKSERENAIRLMRSIFEVQSESGNQYDMLDFITSFIKDLAESGEDVRFEMDESFNIYVTKGKAETYPCIVAHMDTVHRVIPYKDYRVLNSDTEFFAINMNTHKKTGIGGDDNNGIYCALDNLLREDNIKLAFFVDEEIGCVGSAQSETSFFDDCSFVLQADRKGYHDVAQDIMYTQMFDDKFLHVIKETLDRYNRRIVDGGMTDVMQLAHNGVDVAMANFSCGYYLPHTDSEYVVIDELILTSILFRDIIRVAYEDGKRHEMIRDESTYDGYYGGWGYDYYGYGKSKPKKDKEYYSELESDEDGMSSRKRLLTGSVDPLPSNGGACSYCGQETMWDESMEMGFCNNCMDYDYNSANRDLSR